MREFIMIHINSHNTLRLIDVFNQCVFVTLCNKTEAIDSPKHPKSEKSLFITGGKTLEKATPQKKKKKNELCSM